MKSKPTIQERAGLLRDSVFAANDGVVTTFAIMAGAEGASLTPEVVVILGMVNLFADGISMASGNYLAIKSEMEFEEAEGQKELSKESPIKHGIVTLVTFSLVGFLPLIPYILGVPYRFYFSMVIVVLTLFGIGSSKGTITQKGIVKSGLEMLFVGGLAALAAFFVGSLVRQMLPGIYSSLNLL